MSIVLDYEVWYRHSGETEIDEIPLSSRRKMLTEGEIVDDIKDHYITHMSIIGAIPSLDRIAPRLTHLEISDLRDSSQLNRYYLILCTYYLASIRVFIEFYQGVIIKGVKTL